MIFSLQFNTFMFTTIFQRYISLITRRDSKFKPNTCSQSNVKHYIVNFYIYYKYAPIFSHCSQHFYASPVDSLQYIPRKNPTHLGQSGHCSTLLTQTGWYYTKVNILFTRKLTIPCPTIVSTISSKKESSSFGDIGLSL